jgi:hypothetical protein
VRISYSRLGAYAFCPKKYDYRYVQELPTPPKPELAFGTALHAVLEDNFRKKLVTRRDLTHEEAAAVFGEELSRALAPVPDDALRGANDPHLLRALGEHFLARFLTERAPSLQPAPRGVETPFRLDLPGGHEISGKIDLIDTDWVLHDFKTSGKPYDARRADRTQLVIYAWACERLFGRPPKALCFDVFVKGNGEGGGADLQEAVMFSAPHGAEMAQVSERLSRQIHYLLDVTARGDFPRAFEPARCHWCEYQGVCVKEWEQAGRPPRVRVVMDDDLSLRGS